MELDEGRAVRSKILVAGAVFATAFMFPASAWAAVTFALDTQYAVGGLTPQSVAVGDFNADGIPDIAAAIFNSSSVSVLLNNGDGTFAAHVNYPVGSGPTSVDVGDLNGDGKLDLAVADQASDNASVLLNNGDGTFAAHVNYPVGDVPRAAGIGDFNGDGDPDIATANFNDGSASILLNNGNGTFGAATAYPAGDDPEDLVIADLDGDGKLDLATNRPNDDLMSVLLGNGDGTFAAPVSYAAGNQPVDVAVADLNGDGRLDLATANYTPDEVNVLLGNGDGTFAVPVSYPASNAPIAVAVADIDGDGELDLALASEDNAVAVLRGNGDGTFLSATTHPAGIIPTELAVGDLNADGKPDVVTADLSGNTVSVLLNTSTTTFTTGPTATISGTARQGQTLTADEGTPVPTQDSFAYKWFADGVEIGGETAKTLVLKPAQVGKKISVEVTAIKAGLIDASDTSPETAVVQGIFVPGPKASISGFARIGSTLTANAGSPSPTPTILGYRWFANGQQLTPVTKTLKLTTAHRGKRIQVKVFAIKAGYLTATSLSPATAGVSSLQTKTISMELNDYTVRRGQTVRAEIELLAAGEPWSILLDGKKLASGVANSKGVAVKYFTIPTNATLGIRTIRANGLFPDRTDPDRITVR